MSPVLFRLGPLPISSLGVFLLLAFWLGISMTRRRSPAVGVDSNAMLDLALYMIIAGIVFGRLGYVLVNIAGFAQAPITALTIWRDGGLTFYGALAGGALVAWVYARRRSDVPKSPEASPPGATGPEPLPTSGEMPALGRRTFGLRLLDVAAPGLALGYAVGMVGALMHSTAQNPLIMGKPTGVPWAVTVGVEPIHPTQIYLALAAVAIYYVLREQHGAAPGVAFLTFLFLQAVSRFVVEFFVQSSTVLGPLTLAQVASGMAAPAALVGLLVAARPREATGLEPSFGEPPPQTPP